MSEHDTPRIYDTSRTLVGDELCDSAARNPAAAHAEHMPKIDGLSHIDLTVTDRERSLTWWQDVLGFRLVNRHHDESFDANSMLHPSGIVVTVLTHQETMPSDRFDERRVALDHMAFRVVDRDELQRWVDHLDSKGVDHSGITDIGYGPTLVFRDPDNVQLEMYVQPETFEQTP